MTHTRIFLCLSAWILVLPLQAQIAFRPQYRIETTTEVVCLRVDDFDADGRNDLVFATGFYFNDTADYRLHLYRQLPDGQLAAVEKFHYPQVYPGMHGMSSGDLNNDGRSDLVISYGDTVAVYFQRPQGFFEHSPSIRWYGGNSVWGLACADLNNDNLTDLAVAPWNQFVTRVFYQGPQQTWTEQVYWRPKSGRNTLCPADFNADGLTDLLVSNGIVFGSPDGSGDSLSFCIYLQHPQSHQFELQPKVYILNDKQTSWNFMWGISAGDLNRDGRPDVVSGNGTDVWIWMNDPGNPDFFDNDPQLLAAYPNVSAMAVEDLNNDNKPEILIADNGWDKVSVYESDADFQFDNYSLFTAWQATHVRQAGFAVADLNNDKRKDVAVAFGANGTWGGVTILYSMQPGVATAEPQTSNWNIRVWPNPSQENIYLDLPSGGPFVVQCFDTKGQLRFQKKLGGGIQSLNIHSLEAGLYVLDIRDNHGQTGRTKMLVTAGF